MRLVDRLLNANSNNLFAMATVRINSLNRIIESSQAFKCSYDCSPLLGQVEDVLKCVRATGD